MTKPKAQNATMVVLYYTIPNVDICLYGVRRLSELAHHVEVFREEMKVAPDNVNAFLEAQFRRFNNGKHHPLGSREAQARLKNLKAHTSMSVGDAIRLIDNNGVAQTWTVHDLGFHLL